MNIQVIVIRWIITFKFLPKNITRSIVFLQLLPKFIKSFKPYLLFIEAFYNDSSKQFIWIFKFTHILLKTFEKLKLKN